MLPCGGCDVITSDCDAGRFSLRQFYMHEVPHVVTYPVYLYTQTGRDRQVIGVVLKHDTINTYLIYIINLGLVPAEYVLQGTGLTEESLQEQQLIDFKAFSRAVENMRRYSPDPLWSSHLGRQLGATSHGVIGFAALTAPTVGKAITTFIEWEQMRVNTYDYEFVSPDDSLETSMQRYVVDISDLTEHAYYHFCFFLAFSKIVESLVREIVGNFSAQTMTINFDLQYAKHRNPLEECFDSRLSFESGGNHFSIPSAVWNLASPNYDNETYSMNLAKCLEHSESLNAQNRMDFVVKNLIKSQLEKNISRQSWPDTLPSIADISKLTNTSERTLIRRLGKLNTSYSQIIDSTRREYAHRLLDDARFSVGDISDILGYQSAANFCRAFKVWQDVTPTQYRRKRGPS